MKRVEVLQVPQIIVTTDRGHIPEVRVNIESQSSEESDYEDEPRTRKYLRPDNIR